jgi:hypothetical protein
MLETGLVLGMTVTHLGVPLTDLVAWGLVLALLAAPIPLDDIRRQRLMKTAQQKSETASVRPLPVAALSQPEEAHERKAVVPSTTRVTASEQWQAVSRLVSTGAERAMAVAREQQSIRRELDSLDYTLESLRRELAAVMTLPIAQTAELVPVRVANRSRALAA